MLKCSSKKLLLFGFLLFIMAGSASSLWALTGDVNNSGTTDIVDALMTAQYYVGLIPPGYNASVADVNADGWVTIIDALIIARYFVGLITTFPADQPGTASPTNPPTPVGTGAPTPSTQQPPPVSATQPPGGWIGSPNDPIITLPPEPTGTPDPNINYFYFSYDDSNSTAGAEMVKYRLKAGQNVSSDLARPWEFLNLETFTPRATENIGLFDVSMGLWERPSLKMGYQDEYKLGVYLASPLVDKESRNNVVITLIIDVSGSMGTNTDRVEETITTRMDIVKYGLNRMAESLKDGDVINIITFQTSARLIHQGLTYENDIATYLAAVDNLIDSGSTNLNAGIQMGYQAALATYDSSKTNRVVMLTDAYANTGETDTGIISENIIINGLEGIYFSGLGISSDFNEAYLNELTEAGKGAYFTLATKTDAARAFVDRFYSLLTVAAKDVQFRLDFPEGLLRDVTASEEVSTDPVDVQPTNFSFNTSQYFFEGFKTEDTADFTDKTFKLTITYRDPENGETITETYEKPVSDILGLDETCIRDAETIFLFTELLGEKQEWPVITEVLDTFYGGYTSAVYTEYLELINLYIGDEFSVSPSDINFDPILVGDIASKSVILANNTMNEVTVTNIAITHEDANVNYFNYDAVFPVILPTMETYSFNVTFSANQEGNFNASLNVETDATEIPAINVPMMGTAVFELPPKTPPPPTPTMTPRSIP